MKFHYIFAPIFSATVKIKSYLAIYSMFRQTSVHGLVLAYEKVGENIVGR